MDNSSKYDPLTSYFSRKVCIWTPLFAIRVYEISFSIHVIYLYKMHTVKESNETWTTRFTFFYFPLPKFLLQSIDADGWISCFDEAIAVMAVIKRPEVINHSSDMSQILYSLSSKTSYRNISWGVEAARFGFRIFQSLCNLTDTSAALLPRCLCQIQAQCDHYSIQSRGFETSRDLVARRLSA